MSPPVILIIGAGPNVGAAVARSFAAKGYKLALAARKLNDEETSKGNLNIRVDLSDPENVKEVFEKVKAKLGAPSVVIYNAALFSHDGPDPVLGFSSSTLNTSIAINVSSAIVAMAESIEAFRTLPSSASKTFIYTGNALNTILIPGMMTFGIAKGATAYAIRSAATNELYTKAGMKFYYADERSPDGGPVGNQPNGEESAKVYVELSEGKTQGEWDWVFVKGRGYIGSKG